MNIAKMRRSAFFLCSRRGPRMFTGLAMMSLISVTCYIMISYLQQSRLHLDTDTHSLKYLQNLFHGTQKDNASADRTDILHKLMELEHSGGDNSSYRDVHGQFDTYTLPRLMSCQQPPVKELVLAEHKPADDMTVPKCIKFCMAKGKVYAALFNGSNCYCLDVHGTELLERDSDCNVACGGDKSTKCGGAKQWLFYKVGEADGVRGWTTWMSYGRDSKTPNQLKTRYRGCMGDKHMTRSCFVKLGTSGTDLNNNASQIPSIQKHYIGCFTHQTWQLTGTGLVIARATLATVRTPLECVAFCLKQENQSIYSIMNVKMCLCTNSLGWSRPINTCVNGFGSLVFSTSAMQSSAVILKFEGRLTKRRVAVVAHYRGGSTFASLMFSQYPDSLYVFEPASVFGVPWKGINMSLANEAERSKIFLERIYPLWFNCDSMDLPGIWLSKYPAWGEHNNGLDVFNECKKSLASRSAAYQCSPFIEEKCLISPLVAAKTTRMINSETLRSFTQMATNIDIIHVFRDPRGTLQSRAHLEKYYKETQLSHLTIACWELNQLATVFDDPKRASNVHSMHYEDMARDVIGSATRIYRELDMKLPDTVLDTLNEAVGYGNGTQKEPQNAYGTIKSDPLAKIDSWTKSLNHSMVETADLHIECTKLYKRYSSHYKALSEMSHA